ncbi:MAG: radical SAM protein [Bacteroidales bacterium]|nr:radical SAM protein [Bacteroidales bacterium]
MYKFPKEKIQEYASIRNVRATTPLCKAPLSNLYFSRNGDVISCCFNRDFILGTYPNTPLCELWHGKQRTFFGKTVKQNGLVKGCEMCIREIENRNYHGVIAKQYDFIKPQRRYPYMLEFELDNVCNLECMMCEGQFSSSIRINREKEAKISTPYDSNFLEYISPFLRKARLLRFGGGEPFLIPLYFEMWDIILHENKKANIYVQTNGTIMNDRIRKWLASGQFTLGVSLDSLNAERFEMIRKNARLSEVLHNIDEFISLMPVRKNISNLVISATATRLNINDMPTLLRYANSNNAQIVFNTVWSPGEMAVYNLPANDLRIIADELSAEVLQEHTLLMKHNASLFRAFLQQMEQWHSLAKLREAKLKEYNASDTSSLEKELRIRLENAMQQNQEGIVKIGLIFDRLRQHIRYRDFLMGVLLEDTGDIVRYLINHNEEEIIETVVSRIEAIP